MHVCLDVFPFFLQQYKLWFLEMKKETKLLLLWIFPVGCEHLINGRFVQLEYKGWRKVLFYFSIDLLQKKTQ